jgi:hypothetical protein
MFDEAMTEAVAAMQQAPRDSSPNEIRLAVKACYEGWSREDLQDAVSALSCMCMDYQMRLHGSAMWGEKKSS